MSLYFEQCHGGANETVASLLEAELRSLQASVRTFRELRSFYDDYLRVHGYLSCCICAFGVLSNLANVAVLTRPAMRNATNHLLTAIAVCDSVLMLSYLIYTAHFVLQPGDCDPAKYSYAWALLMLLHANVSVLAHTVSLYLTAVMAALRYAIVKSRSSRQRERTSSAFALIGATTLLVVVLCVPNMLINTPQQFLCDEHNASVWMVGMARVAFSHDCLLQNVNFWLNGLVFKIVPCVFLTVFIALLLHVLYLANQRRRRLLGNDRQCPKRDNTTIMLLLIVAIFLVSELPQGVLYLCSVLMGIQFHRLIYQNLGDVVDLLSLLNSCVNFILYCIMSKKFRQVFKATFNLRTRHSSKTAFTELDHSRLLHTKSAAPGAALEEDGETTHLCQPHV